MKVLRKGSKIYAAELYRGANWIDPSALNPDWPSQIGTLICKGTFVHFKPLYFALLQTRKGQA